MMKITKHLQFAVTVEEAVATLTKIANASFQQMLLQSDTKGSMFLFWQDSFRKHNDAILHVEALAAKGVTHVTDMKGEIEAFNPNPSFDPLAILLGEAA